MGKSFTERNGTRNFTKISQWNALDHTTISRKHRFAQYADNYSSKDQTLNITVFKVGTIIYPLGRFGKLSGNIMLDNFTVISRYDPETKIYLALNEDRTKVRLYKEE